MDMDGHGQFYTSYLGAVRQEDHVMYQKITSNISKYHQIIPLAELQANIPETQFLSFKTCFAKTFEKHTAAYPLVHVSTNFCKSMGLVG